VKREMARKSHYYKKKIVGYRERLLLQDIDNKAKEATDEQEMKRVAAASVVR
jgi:hypothetical protein